MSTKTGTLLAWHSKNHGLDVLRHALRLLKAKGHPIGQVIYLKRKAEPVAVGPEWDGPPVDIRTLTVSDPSNHAQIYEAISQQVIPDVQSVANLHVNVSPGTPAMHCVWLLLHAGGAFPGGTRLWSSQREGRDGPVRIDPVVFPISTYLAEIRETATVRAPVAQYDPEARSPARRRALEDIMRYAGVAGAPLLVLGERGTGKTRLVETIVASIKRRGNVVTVPCGALDSTLAESELFGHVKGAFTGAESVRKGLLGNADGGILFLDEVQDLPMGVQRKLIRFLQDRHRRYRQVGGDKELSVDVEVVCASNMPIADLAERLAPDLFDRLSHLIVTVPPLRDCRDDLVDDWARVWRELRVTTAVPSDPPVHDLVIEALATHPFPGNLRDLQRLAVLITAWWNGRTEAAAVEQAVTAWRRSGSAISSTKERSPWGEGTRRERIRHFQRGLAQWAKERHGTWARAAEALGCDERTLREDAGD
ncbi:MAG: AAA family ATPase [Cyanobacteria bacterium CYA]|nr:MAG: AAA family ATPase [Cyanobacteria bacterium CYA]